MTADSHPLGSSIERKPSLSEKYEEVVVAAAVVRRRVEPENCASREASQMLRGLLLM